MLLNIIIGYILISTYPSIGLALVMEEQSKRMEKGDVMYRKEAWEYIFAWPKKIL